MDIEKIKKFVYNSNKVTSDTVFGMLILNIGFSFMIILASVNQKRATIFIAPMIAVSVLFGVIYALLGDKKEKLKNIYLFLGITGVIIPLTLQLGCFSIAKLSFEQTINLILILLILSILICIGVILMVRIMLSNSKKSSTNSKVSTAIVAPAAVLGTVFSGMITKGYEKSIFIWCFAGLSLCFMLLTIYFSKYYYTVKLEKLAKTGE